MNGVSFIGHFVKNYHRTIDISVIKRGNDQVNDSLNAAIESSKIEIISSTSVLLMSKGGAIAIIFSPSATRIARTINLRLKHSFATLVAASTVISNRFLIVGFSYNSNAANSPMALVFVTIECLFFKYANQFFKCCSIFKTFSII